MDLRHFRYALALAEHQHFGRAAEALGIAQPPLSKQIAALEREVDTPLFERTARGVFPTAAGEAFLARARRALDEAAGATVDARRAARGETGRLRVGFIGSALLQLLPTVVSRFGAAHPEVVLELYEMSSSAAARALVDGEVDVIVTRGAPRGPGAQSLVSVALDVERMVAAVSRAHRFAGLATVSLEQLEPEVLIVTAPQEEPAATARMAVLLNSPRRWSVRTVHTRDVHTVLSLAACGIGVGIGPACLKAAIRPDVWTCEVEPVVELPALVVSFRDGDRSPVLRAFLTVVRDGHAVARARLDRFLADWSPATGSGEGPAARRPR
ncbi:LysR substrate-binding domain-containing protein [Streptomyces sp. NPDC097640]|uniref:LysR family transcriptional regulator n=1 Tax=Streptomyces sp. NPDC097640 TaxID=3157229 RepID=UPI00331CC2C2